MTKKDFALSELRDADGLAHRSEGTVSGCLSERIRAPIIYDQLEAQLPAPNFAKGLKLTVGELFGWLII